MNQTTQSQKPHLRAFIVGGGRGMGAWLAHLFIDQGIECCICDIHADSIREMKRKGYDARHYTGNDASPFLDANGNLPFEMLVFAVPIEQMEKAACLFCCHSSIGTLVMDVCSTKVEPLILMDKYTPPSCEVLGTHPLFGPKIYPPISQTWILTPSTKHPPKTGKQLIRNIIHKSGALVYETTADSHDEAMQIVQVATHLTLLVFGTFLDYAHRSFNELQNFKTPVFELLASLASRVFAQNPALYFNIQKQPRAEITQQLFCDALSRMHNLVTSGTLKEFMSHHERVKQCIGDTNVVALDHVVSSAIRTIANERMLLRTNLGEIVCVKNIETGKIHHGHLLSIAPPLLNIKKKKETVSLSLKKVRLLTMAEKHEWLIANGKGVDVFISFHVPRAAASDIVASQLALRRGVIKTEAVDEYVKHGEDHVEKVTIKVTIDPDVKRQAILDDLCGFLAGLGYTII